MKRIILMALMASTVGLLNAQTPPTDQERWSALGFLEGTWEAKTSGGTANADAIGTYVFRKELGGHILARYTSAAGCRGPADFDCDHGDLLYIYQGATGQPLKAIYFDNEGHVIHYSVSIPTTNSAVFISDPGVPGPRFRLVYELKDGTMAGKFQMQPPGKSDWMSYLEWSGRKK